MALDILMCQSELVAQNGAQSPRNVSKRLTIAFGFSWLQNWSEFITIVTMRGIKTREKAYSFSA